MLIAVDDTKLFHSLNIKKEANRKDYTYFARYSYGIPLNYCQNRAAKIHINSDYGVVAYSDMIKDLKEWDTLVSAAILMQPYTL